MLSAAELRDEVFGFLRSFEGELEADNAEALRASIYEEFAAATGCFVPRETFLEVLRELGQEPHQNWAAEEQRWRVRRFRLDWGFNAEVAAR